MSGEFVGIDIGIASGAVAGHEGLEAQILALRDRAHSALGAVGMAGEHGGIAKGFESIRTQSEAARTKLSELIAGMESAATGGTSASLPGVLSLGGSAPPIDLKLPNLYFNPHLNKLLKEKFLELGPAKYLEWRKENADLIERVQDMSPEELGEELNKAYAAGDKDKIQILTAGVWDDLEGKGEEETEKYLRDMGVAFRTYPVDAGSEGYPVFFTDPEALYLLVAAGGIPDNDYIFDRSQQLADAFVKYRRGTYFPLTLQKVLPLFNAMPGDPKGSDSDVLEPMQEVLAQALIEYYDTYVPDSDSKNIQILEKYANGDFFGVYPPQNRPLARLMAMYALENPYSFLGTFTKRHQSESLLFASHLNENLPPEEVEAFFGGLYAFGADQWEKDGFPAKATYLEGLRNFMEHVEEDSGFKINRANVTAAANLILSGAEYLPFIGTGAKLVKKGISLGDNLGKLIGGNEDFNKTVKAAAKEDSIDYLNLSLAASLLASREEVQGGRNIEIILARANEGRSADEKISSVDEIPPEVWDEITSDSDAEVRRAVEAVEAIVEVID